MIGSDLELIRAQVRGGGDVESVIRTLQLLCEIYGQKNPSELPTVTDLDAYSYGWRQGAHTAYADVIARLREITDTADANTARDAP